MSPTAVTKPVLPPLQTPKSASFPSEIIGTPISACVSAVIKQEHDLKTPITPPSAYTEFLKALTPLLASPPHSAFARSMSDESNGSGRDSITSNPTTASSHSSRAESFRSPTATSLPPPTPYSATSAGRFTPTALRRLKIPQHSPVFSPSSTTGPSPRTSLSAMSAMYSPFSPADWAGTNRFYDTINTPRSACSKPVSVRSVVTRTVTYKRTTPNLEPAPKGKKRKIAVSNSSVSSCSSSNVSVSSDDDTKKVMAPPSSIIVASRDKDTPTVSVTEPTS